MHWLVAQARKISLGRDLDVKQSSKYGDKMTDSNHVIQTAVELVRNGKFDDAMELLTNAIRQNPHNTELIYTRGMYQYNSDRFEGALLDFNTIINHSDDDDYVLMARQHRVHVHLHLGDVEKALKDLDWQIQTDNADSDIYLLNAELLDNLGNFDDALKVYNSLLEKDANNLEARLFRGRILFRLKKYDKALFDLTKIIELIEQLNRKSHLKLTALNLRLLLYKETMQYDLAEKDFEEFQRTAKNKPITSREEYFKYDFPLDDSR